MNSSPDNSPAPVPAKSILFAEDDDLIRNMFAKALVREGYTVIPAADGREAYDCFQKHANEIDLIVTDIIMPEMDGRELVQRCRKQAPKIGVLYMSSNAFGRIEPDRDLAGNADFVAKPFGPAELLTKVKSLLDGPKVA